VALALALGLWVSGFLSVGGLDYYSLGGSWGRVDNAEVRLFVWKRSSLLPSVQPSTAMD